MINRSLITREGYKTLIEKLHALTTTGRIKIANDLHVAREHGDLSENAGYQYAKDMQAHNEAKIAKLQEFLSGVEVVDPFIGKSEFVSFGCTARVKNLETDDTKTITIVGETESSPKSGKISYRSPFGKEIIGKSPGDDFEVEAPGGESYWEILEILG